MLDESGRAARHERWARLRRSLWQPPRPHGEQPRERVVGPLELFYDLAVVVLVAQAAHHLAGHLTWHGLAEFAVVFTLVWIAWANGSLHHDLHGHDDARARSTFLLQILVLVAMAAFIPEAGGERGAAFAVAAGVLFAVLAVLWLLAARGDRPQYRRTSGLFVTGTAACSIALAATALLPASARVPATVPCLRRRGRGVRRRRRRPAGATGPRPRARCPAQHPLGTRRRPPPGRPGRLTRSSPKLTGRLLTGPPMLPHHSTDEG